MPRPGPRRPLVNVRLSETGIDLVKHRAAKEANGNQSEMLRRMLKYAGMHMPEGWNG